MAVIEYEVRDKIAYATLNRPEALNGISEEVLDAWPTVLEGVRGDATVKALVITGAGDAFCVGLDIDLLSRAFEDLEYFKTVVERLKVILLKLEALPVPVVAAVNGLARAGGFETLLACDIVLAAEEARIGDTHLSFGIPPGGGASARAPRKLGSQRAAELLLTGKWLTGQETVEYGVALKAVPRAELDAAVEELVARFRPLSRVALATMKGLLHAAGDITLKEALDHELNEFARFLSMAPKADEGYRAYVEKRKPNFD